MSLNSLQQGLTNLDDELEVIRKDAIRLAAVVVNLSKRYRPFQERVRGLGYRALNTSQLSDLEHVCRELRTVYASLLALEGKALAQEMLDDPDLGLDVEPQQVVPGYAESADGRHGADTAMGTVPVVAVQPERKFSAAMA
jgi:hypothetical protein